MFYQAINLGMCISAIIILCSKYGIIKLFNLYYFLTRKWEGMVSVSVPVLDRHILLDAILSFQPWLSFSYKESLLSITACLPTLPREGLTVSIEKSQDHFICGPGRLTPCMNLCLALILLAQLTTEMHSLLLVHSYVFNLYVTLDPPLTTISFACAVSLRQYDFSSKTYLCSY